MKKNFKRWIAFLLAVVLIAGTCIHSSDAFLWAEGEDMPVTPPQEEVQQELTVASDAADVNFLEDEGGDGENFDDEEDIENDDENLGDDDGENDIENEDDGSGNEGEDTEEGEGEDADSEEIADGENGNPGDDSNGSTVEGEDVNEESKDGSEEKGTLSYTIYFYYDGKEDESARISGTDGKLDASILGSLTIEGKKEYDGKNYILERIDNKDGVITEDAGSNVVSVYYVLADEGKKPEEKYGYEIHFYYDGREGDVKKGEEVSGKEILASVTIEDEKEFGGKNYILDSIENENGIISKDTEKNVVNVYYVPAKEDVKTYSLKFESNLSEGGKAEVISVSPDDGKTGSVYKKDAKVTFEVSVNDGYELLSVENQDGDLKARSAKGNAYTYAVTMTEDMVIVVTYEEMPAQVLTADAGTVAVTIDAPKGVLPNGTVAEVQSVDSDDVADVIMSELAKNELYPTEIKAVDITLLKDGQKVSPKGDVTVTLDNVFDTDIPGKETAVYYINGGSAVDVKADPTASGVTFTTNHFSTYAAVKAMPMSEIEDGIMTLDMPEDNGVNRGIKVVKANGQSFTVEGTDGKDHSWTVDNSEAVYIEKESYWNSVGLKPGEQAGTAILTHSYDGHKEYWTIKVIGEEVEATLRVYVYIQVKAGVDTTGWTLNAEGYYTVGYIDVDPAYYATELEKDNNKLYEYLKQGIKDKRLNIVVLNDAINIDLSEVTWNEVVESWGANDFEYLKEYSIHLNGTIEMEYGSFKVEYYKDGTRENTEEVKKPVKWGADNVSVDAKDFESSPFGEEYVLKGYQIGEGTVSIDLPSSISKDGTIKVYYVSKSKPCKVTYILNGGKVEEQISGEHTTEDDSIIFSVKTNDLTPVIPDPKKTGYTFDSWTPEIAKTVSGDTTYTAQYKRDAAFQFEGYKEIYDTRRHGVTLKEGVLLDGETVQYYYNGDWKTEEQMKSLWPKDVTVSETAKDGIAVPVKVLDKNGEEVWHSAEGNHPYIKITPYPVTINVTSTSKTWQSDGNYQFDSAKILYDGMSDELKSDLGSLGLDLTVKRIFTENKAGEYKNDLTLADMKQFENEKYSNYSFTVVPGDFTITKIQNALKVSLTEYNGTYDGEWHSITSQVTVDDKIIPENEYSIIYSIKNNDGSYTPIAVKEAQRKDAGTSLFKCTVSMEGYEDASSKDGAVIITPKEITIKVKSAEKEWGEEDPEGYEGYEDFTANLIGEDKLRESSFTVSRKKTGEDEEVNKYEKVLTIQYEESDINPNYTVKVEEGDFEIKGRVTYDGNGNTSGTAPKDDTLYSRGNNNVSVQDKGTMDREKAVFLGWSRYKKEIIRTPEDESVAQIIKENEKTSMGSESFTLHAVWAVDEDDDDIPDYRQYLYSLKYDLNGGNGTAPEDKNKYKQSDVPVALAKGNPETLTKDNAVFVGWSQNKEAVERKVFSDRPGDGIIQTSVTFGTKDITVYAVWAEDKKGPEGEHDDVPDYDEYSITYDSGKFKDLQVLGVNTENVLYAANTDVILTPYITARPGNLGENELVLFASAWENSNDGEVYSLNDDGKFTYKMPAADVTFTAQWEYLTVTKTISGTVPEGGYKADNTVLFDITVENKGDVAADGIAVKELLSGAKIKGSQSNETTLTSLAVGQKETVQAEYTVTDADLRAGELKNTVSITDNGVTATASCDIERQAALGSLYVEKKIVELKKESYAVGDKIEFEVTVRNNGTVTVKDIELTESFSDAVIEEGNSLARFLSKVRSVITGNGWKSGPIEKFTLKTTDTPKTFRVIYEVQEEDLGHSGFYNVATATGHIDGSNDPVIGTGRSGEITIDDPNSEYKLTKEVVAPDSNVLVEGKYYPIGSSVEYKIRIENTGNTTLSNLQVKDTMQTSDGTAVSGTIRQADVEAGRDFPKDSDVTWDGSTFTITRIPRGETAEFTYKYEIQEGDAGKKIQNIAIIGNDEPVSPEKPIEVVNEALTVTKTASEPENGEGYQLGETIKFAVEVKNTGNVTLSGISVKDEKVERGHGRVEFVPDDNHAEAKIASLAPGDSETLYYNYTVMEDDLEQILENVATATVKGKDFPSNTVVMKQVEDKTQKAELEKKIVNINSGSGGNGRFAVDDLIQYEIRVTNTGTQTLNHIEVTDSMTGAAGTIEGVQINGETAQFTKNDRGYVFIIPTISPKGLFGQEGSNVATITYIYKVQKADAGATISNTAILPAGISKGDKNPDPVTIEKKALDVTKRIVQVRPNGNANFVDYDGKSFTTGDVVRFEIVVKNTGNVSLSGIKITDSMSGEADADGKGPQAVLVSGSEIIASLEAGGDATLVYDYTVRPEDIAGESTLFNKAVAEVPNTDVGDSETVEIPLVEKESGYSVEKKFENSPSGNMYRKDDLIQYSIEIRNTGNTVYPAGLEIKDAMSYKGEEGTPKGEINITSKNASWENGKFVLNSPLSWGGDPVRILYTYKVDASDEGKILQNTAYDSAGNPYTVGTEIEQKKLTVTKEVTNRPADNTYAVDEYIKFKVTLKNEGNVPLENISVTDRLWSKEGSVAANLSADKGQNPFADGELLSLAVGELREFEYTYQVKETDLGKEIYNVVTASGEGFSEEKTTPAVKVENPDPKVSLTKSISTSTPPDGEDGRYKTGTTVTYEIRVKNTGNITLNNVTVKDTMVGAVGQINAESVTGASMTTSFNSEGKWEYTFEIDDEIARGEEKVITYDYVIQKEDAGKKIGNTVTVDGDNITTDDDSDDSEEIVVENRKLTVTKTARPPKDGIAYRLGEEIIFDVKVDNEGDVTLSGINLVDEMLGGAAGMAELVEGIDPGFTLVSQEAEDFVYKYVVQPGDIIEGTGKALKNKLTATSIDGTKGEDETDYLKIEGANPAYSILKGIPGTDKDGDGKYAIGEDINYEITIFNDGNVALPYMTVEDRMENASGAINADSVKATIETAQNEENNANVSWNSEAGQFELTTAIPIGGKAVITYNYKVVEGDAGKIITNIAAGKGPGEGAPSSKETVAQVEDRRIEVEKVVTSTPDNPTGKYVLGNNILFDVTVKNPGDVAVSGINITDAMQGAIGAAVLVDEEGNALNDGSDENISLQAGEERVLHYSYTVQREDIVAGGKDIANTATATASPGSESLSGKTEDTTTPVQVDRLHTLTVNYQYADGSIAAQTLTQDFAYGESFAFTIPSIAGYTSTLEGNPVQQSIMFVSTLYNAEDDPVFTIIYNAVPATEPTPEPGTEPSATPTPGGGEPAPADDTPDTPVPPTPPVPPVDDGPLPEAVIVPVAPAAVAAAPGILGGGAGLVAIGDEPVPLDGVITQDDDGNVVIVPVDEVEIPLADRELDDHKCCILSFLLMLATLIIYSWFTHSMKKRQKKLAELKDQLAEETLKRQLGIADTKNSAR